ncbi:MAG TPA: hypothetical protein VGD43_23965 [Micromonospora sp.]
MDAGRIKPAGAGADASRDSSDASRDSGRVSVFVAIALFAVLVIIGLVVDGATRLSAMQVADNLAAEAARAGGQAIDEKSAIGGGPKEIDKVAAARAVDRYRRAAGVDGPPPEFPVENGKTLIRVEVVFTYQPVMLSFFGWDEPIEIVGRATANPLTEP